MPAPGAEADAEADPTIPIQEEIIADRSVGRLVFRECYFTSTESEVGQPAVGDRKSNHGSQAPVDGSALGGHTPDPNLEMEWTEPRRTVCDLEDSRASEQDADLMLRLSEI